MAESRKERRARKAAAEELGNAHPSAENLSKPKKQRKTKTGAASARTAHATAQRDTAGNGKGDQTPMHGTGKTARKKPVKAVPQKKATPKKAKHDGAPCPVMHACGGCTWLNLPYKKQLARKQQAIEELFSELCERADISVDPIRGMGAVYGDAGKYPAPRGFRHKAATPFSPGTAGTVRCGFFKRGTHNIVEIPDCCVEAPGARRILNEVARVAEAHRIPAYNEDAHVGLLRYAVLRLGWRTDEIMLTVVTAQRDLPDAEAFWSDLAAIDEKIVTVAQNINNRVTNAIHGDETRVVWGKECLRDHLLSCDFDISPTAFYQTNPEQTEVLYQLAIDGMDLQRGDVLLDAYCGSGTIGLCAARAQAEKGEPIMLFGVERNEAGISDARKNAKLNGLTRGAWFIADDATEYMLNAADNHERVDVLSIDPPRAGSTPEFLEAVIALRPRRIVYISCNPTTQERDLHPLMDAGYQLLRITPVDMFPHSSHIETIAVLER